MFWNKNCNFILIKVNDNLIINADAWYLYVSVFMEKLTNKFVTLNARVKAIEKSHETIIHLFHQIAENNQQPVQIINTTSFSDKYDIPLPCHNLQQFQAIDSRIKEDNDFQKDIVSILYIHIRKYAFLNIVFNIVKCLMGS